MRSRDWVEAKLEGSSDVEMSLEVVGKILLDIRDLLIDLYNRDADVKIDTD